MGTYIIMFAAVVILLRPTLIGQYPELNRLFQAGSVAVFFVLVGLVIIRNITIRAPLVLLILYRLVLLFPTLYNDGDTASWAYYSIVQISLLLVVELTASRGKTFFRVLIDVLTWVLIIYMAVNVVTIQTGSYSLAMWASGFTQPTYFLGIRTRVTDVIFPAMLVAQLSDRARGRSIGWRTVVVLVLGVWQLMALQVATGLVGIGVALLIYLSIRILPLARRFITMTSLTFGGLVLSAVVIFGRIQESRVISDFIAGTLEKSLTLTGRTEIWEAAVPIIRESLFFGHGVNDNFGAFVSWTAGTLWQAHNQYLQLAYDSGVLGIAVFVSFLVVAGRCLDRSRVVIPVRAAFLSAYGAFMLMFVSEIYTYNMGLFFLIPFLASSASLLEEHEASQ